MKFSPASNLFVLAALAAAALCGGGCTHLPARLAAQWPAPALTYTHAATAQQAALLLKQWTATPGHVWGHAARTGSMLPHIRGGFRECLLYENYRGQPLRPGMVVAFARLQRVVQYDSMGILVAAYDRPEWGGEILHMIVAVSADGKWMLLTGTNTRNSDGWQPVANTSRILREVVTIPAGVDVASAWRAP